jgi:branched-chain amino acid transport system permease protein
MGASQARQGNSGGGTLARLRDSKRANLILVVALFVVLAIFPLFFDPLSNFIDDMVLALAYVVMALGLNIVVGFAGLLDLGYVAFYAFGAYTIGWFASDHFAYVNNEEGIHVFAGEFVQSTPGIHLNFLLILVIAAALCALVGAIIGLPTLRLRGDYIAIVTLAFGEIIYRFAVNGDEIHFAENYALTNGRQAIAPIDQIDLPFLAEFDSAFTLRPFYWFALALVAFVLFCNFRLRDSRLGRAWIAIREDEVAAASMGVPLVKTKLLAYAAGAAFGGIAGAFLGSYLTSVNAQNFQFGFSIFVLAMIILGGLGSIWGVVLGAVVLSFINYYFIPDVFNSVPRDLGLDFDLSQLSFGIFGFLILIVMVLRPEGLLPERRRRIELTEGLEADADVMKVSV